MARALLFLLVATSGCAAQTVVVAPPLAELPESTAEAPKADDAPPRKRRIGRLSPPFSGASAVRSTLAVRTSPPNAPVYSQR